MRISPVSIYPVKQTSFKGQSQTVYVNCKSEEEIPTTLDLEAIPLYGRQSVVQGKRPLERVEGTYPPDIMMRGKIYFADWGEWVGDWAKGTHSAVVADRARINLTEERVKNYQKDNPDELDQIRKCLEKDVEFKRRQVKRLTVSKTGETEEETAKREAELKEATARLAKLQEMKATADDNYKKTLQYLLDHNYDYYKEKAKREGRIKKPGEDY